MMEPIRLILASASPRRREILENLGVRFEVVVADVDESSDLTDPGALVEELSLRKAAAVRDRLMAAGDWDDRTLVLASDTVVATEGKILGKPADAADAASMLRLLSGRSHSVVSGVALVGLGREEVSHDETQVRFDELSEDDITFYIRSNEPFGKAGAYAVQGLAALWITGLVGDYFNVVGLPVHRLFALLKEAYHLKLTDGGTLGPV